MSALMTAAVYARKSTDQSGISDEAKSVTRQVEHAKAYATAKGWAVDESCVFVDDGISGAEFSARPGFVRLMDALKPRPPFQVLVMSEESRLGREAIETAYALKQLVTSGVRVFFYLEDRERTLNSPMEKAMLSIQAMADEIERERARLRVTDAMRRKARAGHCCGGRVFGYDNVEVLDQAGKRSHVSRVINEAEAAIVRRIFALSSAGTGYTRIAKLLNTEGAAKPRPKQGRIAGWAPSSVKEILDRRLYLGEVTWNRTQRCDTWGQKRLRHRPAEDWITLAVPELRIVGPDDWAAAHGRLDGVRARLNAASHGPVRRRARDIDSAYLLSGFARCGVCGGSLGVMSGSRSSARRHSYGCLSYLKRGTAVCSNSLRLPLATVDDAVMVAIGGIMLDPDLLMEAVDGTVERVDSHTSADASAGHLAKLAEVEREIVNYSKAIGSCGNLPALLAELQARIARRDELLAQMAAIKNVDTLTLDRDAIEAKVRPHIDQWRSLIPKGIAQARQFLREALSGPIVFTPAGRMYRFDGRLAVGRFLSGTIGLAPLVVAVHHSVEGCVLPFAGTAA